MGGGHLKIDSVNPIRGGRGPPPPPTAVYLFDFHTTKGRGRFLTQLNTRERRLVNDNSREHQGASFRDMFLKQSLRMA